MNKITIKFFLSISFCFWSLMGMNALNGQPEGQAILLPISHDLAVHAEESPVEDLASEHGIVERILSIYEEIKNLLLQKQKVESKLLFQSVDIVRKFVEDYHEKTEENFIFPLFENKDLHVALIRELRKQHTAGRVLTDKLLQLGQLDYWNKKQKRSIIKMLDQFITMYRFHISREDTNLFPEFRKLVSKEEYERLGKLFDTAEDNLFGKDGYQVFLRQIEQIERKLGIFNITKFTPIVPKK